MGTAWFCLSCLMGHNIVHWRSGEFEEIWCDNLLHRQGKPEFAASEISKQRCRRMGSVNPALLCASCAALDPCPGSWETSREQSHSQSATTLEMVVATARTGSLHSVLLLLFKSCNPGSQPHLVGFLSVAREHHRPRGFSFPPFSLIWVKIIR